MPKCRTCGAKADKEAMTQIGLALVCRTDACIAGERLKVYDKAQRKRKAAVKAEDREQKTKDAAWKRENESLSTICARVQKDVNKLYMIMDAGKPCISCGAGISEAGHYYHAGSKYRCSLLRFMRPVINGQCHTCNHHKGGGNQDGQRLGIIERYGQEGFDYLEEVKRQADSGEHILLTKDMVRGIGTYVRAEAKRLKSLQ